MLRSPFHERKSGGKEEALRNGEMVPARAVVAVEESGAHALLAGGSSVGKGPTDEAFGR